MSPIRPATLVVIALIVLVTVVPGAAAAQPGDADACLNADRGPGDDGPPGFVADLVPNFISDLIGSLPVPNFVKTFFGATTC